MNLKFLYVLFLLVGVSSLVAGELKHLFVVSGVVVNSGSTKRVEDFVEMLEKKSAYKLKPFYVHSYEDLSQKLRDNPNALAWTCGAPYVEDSAKDGQQLVAVPLYKGTPTYKSLIVSRKDTNATSLLDFRGKIFTYSDSRSNSGYVAPAAELKKNGYNIKTFFSVEVNAGIHEKSINAIYRGLADVGAIDEYVWIEYTKTRPEIKEKLHIIERLGPFAFTPIVAGKGVSKETIQKVQKALVEMTPKELEMLKKNFNMDGFVVKDRSFYKNIQENMTLIGIDTKD